MFPSLAFLLALPLTQSRTTGQTLEEFKSAAANVSSSSEPPQVQGGEQSGEISNTTSTSASVSGAKATVSASTPAKSNAYRTPVSTILGVVSLLISTLSIIL